MGSNSFWDAVTILISKPHVVNKRLWGSKQVSKYFCVSHICPWTIPSLCKRLESNTDTYADKILDHLGLKPVKELNATIEVILLELLPKVYCEDHAFQLVCMSKNDETVVFYDVTPETKQQNLSPQFTYHIKKENDEILLDIYNDSGTKSAKWLRETVLPQFIKWAKEIKINSGTQSICSESLTLVSNDAYYQKYNELKLKYGKEMVQIWPECTDPSKYVYEDVAIATYLLLLWEEERNIFKLKEYQSFVDIGCGNGLLVYILTKEGHKGVGIDLRKRNIWDLYPDEVKLEEKAVTPSDNNLFPESSWLIGNHSDELTPWLPVIAAQSSYNCNFFLLPCCTYNFDGTKYQRQNSAKSQYTEYLEFIKELCEDCGFRTDIDRLKIPSTKRICLVGRGRTYPKEEFDKYCFKIQKIISGGRKSDPSLVSQVNSDMKEFKVREQIDRVRNCTQIDKNIIQSVINCVSDYILHGCNFENDWNCGKEVEINELAQILPRSNLKALKSECGGLQTLLRNNHHIFCVKSGKVQFRYPNTIEEVLQNAKSHVKIRQKPCWFYNNHPQGCPLKDSFCSFLHIKS